MVGDLGIAPSESNDMSFTDSPASLTEYSPMIDSFKTCLGLKLLGWDGWDRTSEMSESKSDALPLGYIPIIFTRHMEWFEKYY